MKIPTRIRTIVIMTLFAAVIAVALAYGVVETARFPHWVVDDAFILYRYAENLAEHGELNWNPGENPVEGYTGIALVTLLSVATKLGISPIAASHALGIAFFFASGILMLLVLRGLNIGSATAAALYFTTPFMFSHAWSGLETTMFAAAILFAVYAFTLRRDKLFGASLLLLSFTRPEGVLLSVLLLVIYRPLSRTVIAVYLAPCVVYFLWRWIYYGRLLPNTFYAKASSALPMSQNTESITELFKNYMRLPALLGLVFFSYENIRKHKYLVGVVTAFVLISLYLYMTSDLVMNYSYRFFVPLYVLSLLAVGGIIAGQKMSPKMMIIMVIILSIQISFNIDKKRLVAIQQFASSHYTLLRNCHIEIGKYLHTHLPPEEWIVVHADAGAIPYYAKLPTLDFGRLNDEFLAENYPIKWEVIRRIGQKKAKQKAKEKTKGEAAKQDDNGAETDSDLSAQGGNAAETDGDLSAQGGNAAEADGDSLIRGLVDYFYSVRPGALVFTSYSFDALRHGSEPVWIASDVRFNNYTLMKKYRSSARNNYYQFVYIRNDLLDLVEVDRTGDVKRAMTIAARRNAESTGQPERDYTPSGLDKRSAGGRKAGPHDRIDLASLTPDSLWTLASEEPNSVKKIGYYRNLVERYGDHQHAPAACFMIGFVYAEEVGDTVAARKAFERVIELYPESEMAESARWMLEQLDGAKAEEEIFPE
jgi:arabinofuranosyltransferase